MTKLPDAYYILGFKDSTYLYLNPFGIYYSKDRAYLNIEYVIVKSNASWFVNINDILDLIPKFYDLNPRIFIKTCSNLPFESISTEINSDEELMFFSAKIHMKKEYRIKNKQHGWILENKFIGDRWVHSIRALGYSVNDYILIDDENVEHELTPEFVLYLELSK